MRRCSWIVALRPLPSPTQRLREISEPCWAWLAHPDRTQAEQDAFWKAADCLRDGHWGPVGLALSFLYPDYFHATTETGHRILVRFGSTKPPLPTVSLMWVGTGDEMGGWTPPPEPTPHWKRNRPGSTPHGPEPQN